MTDHMIAQVDVLARIDDERAWWEGVLAAVGDERMDEVGVTDRWSFKDLIGHLNGWQRRTLDNLTAGAAGSPAPASRWPAEYDAIEDEDESVERINDWMYEQNRDRPVADVVAESRAQWEELRSIVAGLSEAQLNDSTLFRNLDGQSLGQSIASGDLLGHFHEEHEPMIQEWLRTRD